MKTVSNMFGMPPDVRSTEQSSMFSSQTLFGVEVELENMPRGGELKLKYWRVVNDGSLRNHGIEYVFAQPLGGVDVFKALTELERAIREAGFNPSLTDRTSVHVHMDCRNLNNAQLSKLIILYTIFERVLFRYAGPNRWGNIFCLPIEYAQTQIPVIYGLTIAEGDSFVRDILRGTLDRYAALNLNSLRNFGSLEFRVHQGEWKAARLLRWVSILSCLYDEALKDEPILDIHTGISSKGPREYLHRVFGKLAKYLEYDEADIDIMEGVRLSQDIMHCRTITGLPSKKSSPVAKSDLFSQFIEGNKEVAANLQKNAGPFDIATIDPEDISIALGISYELAHQMRDNGSLSQDAIERVRRYFDEMNAPEMGDIGVRIPVDAPPPPRPRQRQNPMHDIRLGGIVHGHGGRRIEPNEEQDYRAEFAVELANRVIGRINPNRNQDGE